MKSFFQSVVFGLIVVSNACASSLPMKSGIVELVGNALDGDISTQDVVKSGVYVVTEVAAIPTAVAGASVLGVTASTGTAVSTLSGIAAVSATSAAIGAPVATALGAVGVVAAPAVVGGFIILGLASGVAYGFNALFFDED